MALALTFAAFALISLGCLWMGLSGLRNPFARIRNASTGASTPAGCSAPAFLSMGLGAALVSYLMGRDVQGAYFVVLLSLAGPLVAIWRLVWLVEFSGAKGTVALVEADLTAGRDLAEVSITGKSAVVAVVNAALGVSVEARMPAHGYRTAPDPLGAYRKRLHDAMVAPCREHRRRALRAWLPTLLLFVGPIASLSLSWSLEILAWQVMAGGGIVALAATLLWRWLERQVRAAMWGVEALLCARGA